MQLELAEQRLVHGGLWRLIRESGRGPDGNAAAVWREDDGFREALRVDILEESVEAIH